MYNQYLKTAPSKIGDNGCFTTIDIPANVPIIEITGNLYTYDTLPDQNHPAILQIGKDLFIGPSGSHDDYINHSCNPNCSLHIIGSRAILYSLYTISAGTELTFDYSTTSTDTHDTWKLDCHCGDYNCRKVISGLHYLRQDKIKEYKDKGMLPLYMTDPRFR